MFYVKIQQVVIYIHVPIFKLITEQAHLWLLKLGGRKYLPDWIRTEV
jgi:hypothetical protein